MQTEFKEMKEERTQMSNYVTYIVVIALYLVFTMVFNKLVGFLVFTFFRGET
jgi:ABC-type arginine transport system permease subunit